MNFPSRLPGYSDTEMARTYASSDLIEFAGGRYVYTATDAASFYPPLVRRCGEGRYQRVYRFETEEAAVLIDDPRGSAEHLGPEIRTSGSPWSNSR